MSPSASRPPLNTSPLSPQPPAVSLQEVVECAVLLPSQVEASRLLKEPAGTRCPHDPDGSHCIPPQSSLMAAFLRVQ